METTRCNFVFKRYMCMGIKMENRGIQIPYNSVLFPNTEKHLKQNIWRHIVFSILQAEQDSGVRCHIHNSSRRSHTRAKCWNSIISTTRDRKRKTFLAAHAKEFHHRVDSSFCFASRARRAAFFRASTSPHTAMAEGTSSAEKDKV